jgi:tetratricopeptide (TPR) repeat protein/SAM-dependent methyltransferase
MPNSEELLAAAVSLHRAGRLDDAERAYRALLSVDPSHVDGLQLLGLVLHRRGRSGEGLALLDRAVAGDPEHLPALTNRATVLRDMSRFSEAEASARAALAVDPAAVPARTLLLGLLVDQSRMAEAEPLVRGLLRDRPDSGRFWAAAGMVLDALERPVEAERAAARAVELDPSLAESWLLTVHLAQRRGDRALAMDRLEHALRHHPEIPELHLKRGNLALEAGDAELAERCFQAALAVRPEYAEALHNLGSLWIRGGRPEDGIRQLATAAALSAANWPWISLVDAIVAHGAAALGDARETVITAAIVRDGVDIQGLEIEVWSVIASAGDGWMHHPLLGVWLERAIVRTERWERALTALRAEMLRDVASGGTRFSVDAVRAMAVQGWHNEFAWWVGDDERAVWVRLREQGWNADPRRLAALAMYAPLASFRGAEALADDPAWRDGPLAVLFRMQVAELRDERALRDGLPVIAMTDDAASRAVRSMYEENPYPRWVSIHRKPPEPLARILRAAFPHARVEVPSGSVDILVAGCGTGQQALAAATRYDGARVLAVDLSRASLGVAARLARAWKLENLRFAQADILALGALDQRFDVVEAGGVLHHLADPIAGWRVLTGLTKPGGILKIALYSTVARAPVFAGRALCAELGVSSTPDGIRRARRAILDLPASHAARPNVASPDFFSTSGFRDLLLHVEEHTFTLPEIAAHLDALGLEFLGFQCARGEVADAYRARFPDDPTMTDLARWAAFEADHPNTFTGMYQFWAVKR